MARKRRRYYGRRRRAISRRPNRLTLCKIIKTVIAVGPVATKMLNAYQDNGGGLNGLRHGALPALTTSYTGFNTNDGKFYPNDLIWGYLPLAAAWAFGKINQRVRIF